MPVPTPFFCRSAAWIVERLGQIDARLGGLHVGRGALAAEILGDDQQHALLADR